MYQRYRRKVETFRKGVIAESTSRKEEQKKKAKKSRWGDESDKVVLAQPGILPMTGTAPPGTHPQLIQYAIKVFGTTDLEASQWKQCEDQMKVHKKNYTNVFCFEPWIFIADEFCLQRIADEAKASRNYGSTGKT